MTINKYLEWFRVQKFSTFVVVVVVVYNVHSSSCVRWTHMWIHSIPRKIPVLSYLFQTFSFMHSILWSSLSLLAILGSLQYVVTHYSLVYLCRSKILNSSFRISFPFYTWTLRFTHFWRSLKYNKWKWALKYLNKLDKCRNCNLIRK